MPVLALMDVLSSVDPLRIRRDILTRGKWQSCLQALRLTNSHKEGQVYTKDRDMLIEGQNYKRIGKADEVNGHPCRKESENGEESNFL